MPQPAPRRRPLASTLSRGTYPEYRRIAEILRKETVGGALLLLATVAALVWANSPAGPAYTALRDARLGYAPWHLELSVGSWAADGLLALFFFVAGLELKREFVAGDLRRPSAALVPVVAAFGGVAVPALVYVGVNLAAGSDGLKGWAIPTATDIAFALAVLAVISTHLPAALRTFLLTLAVVDDLLAIAIIAFFYSSDLAPAYLLLALVPLSAFGVLVQLRVRAWYLLVPLALATWALVHASGIHATVAGVLLAFTVPVLRSAKNGGPEAGPGLAEIFEHRLRPLSAGVAVPVFAFFSAGVAIGGWDGLVSALQDPVALGIAAALVAGKAAGVFSATWLVAKSQHADLDSDLAWIDLAGLALLTGVGFTVSLLISELSFGPASPHGEHAKAAILAGSVTAALLAAVVLRARNRHYRRVEAAESVATGDADGDGIPDAFERGTAG
ncbi:Na(+)/H(+) antiporter NhaA [Sinomonas atrocyanea]|uniref:Na(+)/H(+) antiporter NhaA n=1 Tax=Sinomonas atrocyanea TaxID=37927 RepID=A0A127A3E4_9MICC|nr:Na+/H+ antiporter NhaA [Sinomonas atrocyanea]AMM32172.1 Na(+)/H(+) antiporter NhaA [Sinomonas atrocyanea]GEB64772.1 Na(+)/H(+) antiporter NhaA [Sinomonas atrocyanea]GGG67080.1 Na(+)/H(+) antiporter NhaA [Sinomonas atrocyanea]